MTAAFVPTAAPIATSARASSGFSRRLIRRPIAMVCLVFLVLLIAVAILAPILLPKVSTESAGDLLAIRQGPSPRHLLGTDTLGRDVLSRLLVGTGVSMFGVAVALVIVVLLGVPLGLAAGYYGHWTDSIVGWLADLTFAMPGMIIILTVVAVFPGSTAAAMATLGVLAAPGLMRVVRSATLQVREELYVAAARVSGVSHRRVIGRHVLPRIAGPIIVQISFLAATALLVQTGLAFLNLLVAAPSPSWGGMIADGISVAQLDPWLIWPPGVVITLTVLAFGLLGDAARDTTTDRWSAGTGRLRSNPRVALNVARTCVDRPQIGSSGEALLQVEHVSVAFSSEVGDRLVVQDVTFNVMPGEVVALVGESGCGKTITAMSILGLLPSSAHITTGAIRFGDRNIVALPESALQELRGTEIGLISQEPMISLDPAFRVGSQLAEVLRRHRGVSRRVARKEVAQLLSRVQLPNPEDVARRYPHELSGGMAQRVAIARALAGEPRLLIADEPTTALDVTIQAEILDLLRLLQKERGMAILFVTHDWGVVADICDRGVVMYAGEVVERADVSQLFSNPKHPYTAALLAANPHGAVRGQPLPTLPGSVPQAGEWPSGCHFNPRCRFVDDACRIAPIPLERLGPASESRCIRPEVLAGKR